LLNFGKWAMPRTLPQRPSLPQALAQPQANVDHILSVLEQMLGCDANLRRLPHRLHWVLWLLADLDQGQTLDG
jgi:hypothetical protein